MRNLKKIALTVLMVTVLSLAMHALKEFETRRLTDKLREIAAPGFQPMEASKLSGCIIADNLPDAGCTPGAIFPETTREMICKSGYARSVRNVSSKTKEEAYAMYSIMEHPPGAYEVDHFISLELGGSNDIANLWPEQATASMNSHEKDKVENFLHQELCAGRLSVSEVQELVSWKWHETYNLIK